MKNKVWFITGASKGIGLVLAKKLLQSGYKVAATSRDMASLIKAVGAKSDHFLPLTMDLQSEGSVRAAVEACVQTFGGLDSLVNNAGYGLFGTIEELSDEESRENYNVNVFGLLNVLRVSLPILRKQKSGHIFNISSVGGFAGGFPGVGIYCSTKFAVAGITEGLKAEVEPFGIKTTLVYPGYFRTNFLDSGSMVLPKNTIKAYAQARGVIEKHQNDINGQQPGDPEKIASALIEVYESAKAPLHLFLGSDAVQMAKSEIKIVENDIEEWLSVSTSTDFG
ncbi:MAG: SDR family NAD(P)-dependent oxidoreductase [Proteobacteria bacterium]|nr:MAG: SDR family NAD(P)-dependent oxidoreductase [Pseudomonadota bacterium]